MTTLHFEWDEPKANANIAKHGVSFDEAKTVFYDERARLIADPDHSEDEERFKLLIVCHCYRATDGVIRIISARKATKHEAASY